VEILTALKKLGEQLKPQEAEFLAVNTNAALSSFEKVSENMGKEDHLLVNKKTSMFTQYYFVICYPN